jgi:hypothetical protein
LFTMAVTALRAAVAAMAFVTAIDVLTCDAWMFALCDAGLCSVGVARGAAALMVLAAAHAAVFSRGAPRRRHCALMYACMRLLLVRDPLAATYGDAYLCQMMLLAAVLPDAANRVKVGTVGPATAAAASACARRSDAVASLIPDMTTATLVALPYVMTAAAKGDEWWSGRALELLALAGGGARASGILLWLPPGVRAVMSGGIVCAQLVCGVVLMAAPILRCVWPSAARVSSAAAVAFLAGFHACLLLFVPQVGSVPLCFACGLIVLTPPEWLPVWPRETCQGAPPPAQQHRWERPARAGLLAALGVSAWACAAARSGHAIATPCASAVIECADALGLCNVRARARPRGVR